MDVSEILFDLERNCGFFDEDSLRAAVAQREEITPHLLDILSKTTANARVIANGRRPMGILFSTHMYLLAAWRETAAYPLLIEFCRLPDELPHHIAGDMITEDLGRILASVFDGNPDPIHALIEDPKVDVYVRDAALQSLVVLVACERIPRAYVIDYFKLLFGGELDRRPSQVWTGLVGYAGDLQARELLEDIRRAYEDGLADPGHVELEYLEKFMHRESEGALAMLRKTHTMIGDPIKEIGGWPCFKPVSSQRKIETTKGPVVSKLARTGPCPCGSRKKYKKCCGKVK